MRLHQCMCWARLSSSACLGRSSLILETVQAPVGFALWLRSRYSYESVYTAVHGMRAMFFGARRIPGRGFAGRQAPVDVVSRVWAPSRTCKIAASSHLDLAHRPCGVFVAAIDRLRTKGSLSDRRCREQSDGGQESYGDCRFHHSSSRTSTMNTAHLFLGRYKAGAETLVARHNKSRGHRLIHDAGCVNATRTQREGRPAVDARAC